MKPFNTVSVQCTPLYIIFKTQSYSGISSEKHKYIFQVDFVIVLKKGVIVESGPFSQLVQKVLNYIFITFINFIVS